MNEFVFPVTNLLMGSLERVCQQAFEARNEYDKAVRTLHEPLDNNSGIAHDYRVAYAAEKRYKLTNALNALLETASGAVREYRMTASRS